MSARVVPSKAPHRPTNTHQIHLVKSTLSNVPNPKRSPHTFLHRRVIKPLLDILRMGCSPRRLAWSVAIGLAVGLNPLIGSTTLVSLATAGIFRLNLVASQLAAHLVYPLEVALFFVFIRLGDRIFHTGRMPLHREAILSAFRHHPWNTTRLLWTWEWHALAVWAVVAIILTPLLASILIPVFERLHVQTPRPSLIKA